MSLLPLAVIGLTHGGYFPTSWGWSTLFLLAFTGLAVGLRTRIILSGQELAFIALAAALLCWVLASLLWTSNTTTTMQEAQRMGVYLAGVVAVLVVVEGRSYRVVAGGIWGGITVVAAYALATRLFPERLGRFDSFAGYRLSEPVGYWNTLGLLAGMGAIVALGLAAHARAVGVRLLASASLPVLLVTLYFTFGRGAWLAAAAGLAVAVALDPRRLQLVVALFAVGPPAAAAVLVASRSTALTRLNVPLAAASQAGHRFAVILVLLSLASVAAAGLLCFAQRRVRVPSRVRIGFAGVLIALLLAALVGVTVRYGSPLTLASRAHRAFTAPPPTIGSNLNERLFSFSGNGRAQLWRVGWREARAHPWLGGGAGSYELYWMRHRPQAMAVRDTHNLYLETLAELGPLGLGLLLALLALPVAVALRARRHGLVPPLLGAYVAYLVHAIADWDWEMPVVTLAALLCGGGILAVSRREDRGRSFGTPARVASSVAVLVAAAFAFAGLIGNTALASSRSATAAEHWGQAEAEARKARRWEPWSSEPLQLLAEAQAQAGQQAAALRSARQAVSKEPLDWYLWFDLAGAARGAERTHALARASQLDPLSPEIARFRASLGITAGNP